MHAKVRLGSLVIASMMALEMSSAGSAPAQVATAQEAAAQAGSGKHVVTLITGDRVVFGDAEQLIVIPGAGRRHVGFRTHTMRGRFFVVPTDVSRLVASGRLDRRLFDITGLIEAGYDDRETRSIPLIVTYDAPAGRASVRNSGAETVRELPSINGTAVRVPKGGSFLAGGQRLAAGVERVWLDGKRRTTLDQSVPQIGAPAAWQAGLTGKGVTVAVLDTGVDATHPDLADQVTDTRNFTQDPAGDQVGHGTHVASTIAGTAAAAAGRYKGVAPDATILDGKVCEEFGCLESAILAGMEWAASDKRADVINLSLGGGDTPEVDPLEEAVNTLTAQTGALFVIAAGNAGSAGAATVGSPGSADAALTVGAVDKSDELADFSSRGPRVGDGAIKPDITAPGVGIVAAKSKDAVIGEPVGERYLRLDGTSMATPHVVGAAALLRQQHPDWTAVELKAALMSSAKPHPGQGVFDQGAGRVDVARAITQSVVSEPGSLSFGIARWPHHDDAPVVKQITYRNFGGSDVTLDLRAETNGPDGRPAPAGALTLSATSVTVPAGGTATVAVTSNTDHDGPDGAYAGRITATAGSGGVSVVTPLAVDKEVESYDLTVAHIDPSGRPTGSADSFVIGLDNPTYLLVYDPDGTATVRLPKGSYHVDGLVVVDHGAEPTDLHQFIQPVLQLGKDTLVSVDARLTKPIGTTVPRPDAELALVSIGWTLDTAGNDLAGSLHAYLGESLFTAPLGDPATGPDTFTAHVASAWGVPGASGDFANSPYTYHLLNTQQGRLWHGFDRVVKDSELAMVRSQHNVQADPPESGKRQVWKILAGVLPGMGPAIAPAFAFDLPSTGTHYVEAGGTTWYGLLSELILDDEGFLYFQTTLLSRGATYRAGRTYTDRWSAAVFGPGFATLPGSKYATRTGDHIGVGLAMYSDQDGHAGNSRTDTASTKLYRNGELIGESDDDASIRIDDVPGEKADFKLVSTATRPKVSRFSTRTDAEWTFSSQTTGAEFEALPLWAVRYFPAVDVRNASRRQPVTVLPVKLETERGAKVGTLTKVQVRVSGDDGTTWTNAAVRRTGDNRYVAVFATPPGSYVSLKAKAADSDGNTTEQTIIRAYALR